MALNPQNLIPFSQRSVDEARALGAKGGYASGVTRRRNKTIRESLKMLLAEQAPAQTPEEVREYMARTGVEDPSLAEAIACVQAMRALTGDTEAARYVRDSAGEAPTAKLELGGMLDKPIAALDLSALSDAQLHELAEHNADADDA